MMFWEQFSLLILLNLNYLKHLWESKYLKTFSYQPGLSQSSVLCLWSPFIATDSGGVPGLGIVRNEL